MADVKNDVSTNLLAYWELEESTASSTWVDSHGSYNLTNSSSGTGVTSATGIQGNGADFETSDSEHLSIASTTAFQYDPGVNNISCSFWFKPESLSGTRGLVGKYVGTANKPWLVYTNGTTLTLLVGSQGAAVQWGTPLSTGTWYHIVATMDSSNNYQLIVDDGTPATGSGASSSGTTAEPFRIGAYSSTATGFTDGIIDEVGIWDKKLSAAEITTLYNSGDGIPYEAPASGPANLKTYNTITKANTKTINGIAIANVKTLNTIT